MAKFLDTLRNANVAAQGWKWAAFATTGMMAVLAVGMVWVSTHQTVILVPAGVAASRGPVTVAAANFAQDAEYLGIVATNDIALALTWTPATVNTQYSRFLNRMTSALYATQSVTLVDQAKTSKEQGLTQVFFPDKVAVVGENKVRISGTLTRWEGEKQTYHAPIGYVLSYQSYNGFLHVNSITAE